MTSQTVPDRSLETSSVVSSAMLRSGPAPLAGTELVDVQDDGLIGQVTPVPSPDGPAFSARRLLRVKWLMLVSFVLICGISIPCIWLLTFPTYSAKAIVRVSPVVSRIVFKTEDNRIVPLYRSYLNTQVSIIGSPAVLERVLDREDVRLTDWYGLDKPASADGARRNPLERLSKALSVQPRRNTELIDVSIICRNAVDAKVLVDAVVDEYRRYLDDSARETSVRRLETLRTERVSLQREIDGLVATKFNLSSRLGTTGPEELRSQLSTHLSSLEAQRATLKRHLTMTQWESKNRPSRSKEGSAESGPESGEIERPYSDDPEWRHLNIEAETTGHQLTLARQQYGEVHPRVKQLVASLSHAEHLIRQREAQLDLGWRDAVLPVTSVANAPVAMISQIELKRQARRFEHEVGLFDLEIDGQRRKVTEAGEIAKQIAQYDEEVRYKRELYDAVRSRMAVLELESKAPARIAVAAHAIEPSKPSRDRRMLLSVMSVGAAMMIALALGYIRISMDSKIREAGEVRYAVRAPFLGQLPPLLRNADLMADASPLVMESVRMVRTALLERLDQTAANVVLVTSSSSQAGKTSFAILLGRSLAMLGKRTLLVEADLRRPSLAERLKLNSQRGLAALLTGATKDEEVIVRSTIHNLDVLPAGELPADFSAELLANGVLSRCLERWKQSYGFVLLDSPPVLPVADARILASQADGTILVLRSSHCRRHEVAQACADIAAAGGQLLGAVLVGVPIGSGYGLYGNCQSYYGEGARVLND